MNANTLAKKIMAALLIGCSTGTLPAQSPDRYEKKFQYSVSGGASWLRDSNLSPYGIHYRHELDAGKNGNIELYYGIDPDISIGAGYYIFNASGSYNLKSGSQVTENVTINYVAPQLKVCAFHWKNCRLEANAGIGYLWYKNESWHDQVPYTLKAHACGVNGNITFAYNLSTRWDFIIALSGSSALKMKCRDLEKAYSHAPEIPEDYYKMKFHSAGIAIGMRVILPAFRP